MPTRLRRALTTTLALLMALWLSGNHWMVLQVTVWSGMILSRSMEKGVSEAIFTTFDGEHPCPLCRIISDAQDEEQGPKVPAPHESQSKLKIDVAIASESMVLARPSLIAVVHWQGMISAYSSCESEPPVPPPRLTSIPSVV